MPTLRQYARQMVRLHHALGRVESVASLAVGSATVTALATGGHTAQKFERHWIVRRDTASAADRIRRCTSLTVATGALNHSGTNYADTTATSESLELYPPELEPYLVDDAINVALGRLKRRHTEILPTTYGVRRYWIGDCDWIQNPGDIQKVTHVNSRVISRNRHFENWFGMSTGGALTADWWTLAGASGTATRTTTGNVRGRYAVALLRSGADVTYTQTIGLLENDVTGDSLRGETVTIVGVGTASSANQLRFRISDGVDTTNTSYHTGGGTSETLTATHTVNAAATTLTITPVVEVNGTVQVDQCYAVWGTLDDAIRRDSWPEYEVPWEFDSSTQVNALILPERGLGEQYRVYSARPYPQFDETRLSAGTADGDSADAPLLHIAYGALWALYESLGNEKQEIYWRKKYEPLAARHLAEEANALPIAESVPSYAPAPYRVR